MAKKSVIIFDGEDMFINPKKNVYSKTKGQAKNLENFKSVRGEEEMGREQIVEDVTSGGGGGGSVTSTPIETTPIVAPVEQTSSQATKTTPVESTAPIAETKITPSEPIYVPPIAVPPILPPDYIAPSPSLPPTRPTPPSDFVNPDDGSGGRYSGGGETITDNPPLYKVDDGTPAKPIESAPVYVAPTPVLPQPTPVEGDPVFRTPPTRPTPPDWINPDDGSGGKYSGDDGGGGKDNPPLYKIDDGTPAKGGPDTSKVPTEPVVEDCPKGYYKDSVTGECIKTPPDAIVTPDPLEGGGSPVGKGDKDIPPVPCPSGFINHPVTGACVPKPSDEVVDDPCSKAPLTPLVPNHEWKKTGPCTWEQVKIAVVEPTTTSTTTTTTTKKVTTSTTTTTTTLASGIGGVVVNTGLGLLPELPTPSGGGGGGGGSEEPMPVEQVAKKNYFWWYVIGGISLYLLLRKKK